MELLEELAYFLQKNKYTALESSLRQGSKLKQLYELISAPQGTNDTLAARKIYNSPPTDKKYLMLKRNLSRKLTEMVLLCEDQDGEEQHYVSTKFPAEKQLQIAEKLLLRNVFHNAEKLAQKALREAEKQELKPLQLQALLMLRKTNALKGHYQQVMATDVKIREIQPWVIAEQVASGQLELIESQLKFSVACDPAIINQTEAYVQQVNAQLADYPSPFLRFYYFQLNYHLRLQQNQPQQALKILKKTERLLKQFPRLNSRNQAFLLNYRKAQCYFLLHEYAETESLIKSCLKISTYQSLNRYEVQTLHFRLLMEQKKYRQAGQLIREVRKSAQYRLLNKTDCAAWLLREGYLYFCLKAYAPQLTADFCPNFHPQLTLQKFLQGTQSLHRDKRGYFMHVWILKILLCLELKDEDLLYEESNKLKVYFQRYLKDIPEERTQEFIKVLYKMGKHFDDSGKIRSIGNKLKEHCSVTSSCRDVNEWLSYLSLWDFI